MKYCIDAPNILSAVGQWLYDWQTLISGIFAVGAAAITVCLLREQIDLQKENDAASLRRRHEAFRVTLSLTLSQICSAIERAMHKLATVSFQGNGAKDLLEVSGQESKEIFEVSPEVITSLQGVIETSENLDLVSLIYQIARNIQVIIARIESLGKSKSFEPERDRQVKQRLVDLADLYALTEALFAYARRETDKCPSSVSKSDGRRILEKILRFASPDLLLSLPEIQAEEMIWRAPSAMLTTTP